MDRTQFPGLARAAKRCVACRAALAVAGGLLFAAAAMADPSGIASYAPINGFGVVGSYGQGLSGDGQKWSAPVFGSGMSSSAQSGGSQGAIALQTLDSSALARNIQVGLSAGTIAAVTDNANSLISTTGSFSATASQSSNVILLGN